MELFFIHTTNVVPVLVLTGVLCVCVCVWADCLPGTDHSWAVQFDASPEEAPTARLPETESVQVSCLSMG